MILPDLEGPVARTSGAARLTQLGWRAGLATDTGLGVVSGTVGAYCVKDFISAQYGPKTIGHSVGLWLFLAVLVSVRNPLPRAVVRSVTLLVASVAAFYVSKKYLPGPAGYLFEVDNWVLWSLAAVPGGVGIGVLGALLCRQRWLGAGALALLIGMFCGDAYHRFHLYGVVDWAMKLDGLFILCVLVIGVRSLPQLARLAALLIPLSVAGYLLTSAPNWAEQILVG